ncbi:MAG TPA: NAD(P)/FAD-dependent oxidoreductase [Pirellulales bacterium]|nr:NAD(P)/FAD-dependent oxidoreductase [Pirellulales bacterium]
MAKTGGEISSDVIVVGAGVAGLAAARRLAAAQLRVTIVEGRNRIGGRIHTLRPPGCPIPIEAGAEFIHGESEETWSIVGAAGLAAHEIPERHETFVGTGLQTADQGGEWEEIFSRLKVLQGSDLSFADFLERHCSDISSAAQAQAVAYVEGFNAADKETISTRWLAQSVQAITDETSFRFSEGYGQVVEWLAAGLNPVTTQIHLGTAARKISWRRNRVELQASPADGQASPPLVAPRLVVALPLGILQLAPGSFGAVEFSPDLAEKRAAWNRLRMGPVVKLVLRFREPFWERDRRELVFLHAPGQPIVTWWTTNPLPSAVLTGWSGGAQTKALEGMTESQILSVGLETLSKLFPMSRDELDRLLVDSHVFDWRADPFSRGAYAYVPVDALDAPDKLAAPVDDTLFFAGEATDSRRMGTVSGAIASGYRAAEEVLRAIQAQAKAC